LQIISNGLILRLIFIFTSDNKVHEKFFIKETYFNLHILHMKKEKCTGVILAGGKNSRLPGKRKGFRDIGGQSIIQRIYDVLDRVVDEVIIVTNDPLEFAVMDALIVTDIDPSRCALAGVHAGIFYASHDKVFITACDTPFVREDVISYIISCAEPGYDVIIPETRGGTEALFAVYTKACLPLIENKLDQGIHMIKKFYPENRVRVIPVSELEKIDPQMDNFFNVNTPGDLKKARDMVKKEKEILE